MYEYQKAQRESHHERDIDIFAMRNAGVTYKKIAEKYKRSVSLVRWIYLKKKYESK